MLVADDDQHIYGFTGASHRYLRMFPRDFAAEERSLTLNFRCDPEIVAVANRLIGLNTDLMPRPEAVAHQPAVGGAVVPREFADEALEAERGGRSGTGPDGSIRRFRGRSPLS